jgi:hypothetical protein
MATNTIQVIVYNVKRGPVSDVGNPSYVFNTDHGPYRTQTNSGAAYALENDFAVNATLDVPATLTITTSGRVVSWELEG